VDNGGVKQREIKFRVWDNHQKEFLSYPCFINHLTFKEFEAFDRMFDVEQEDLCFQQYTGLKDKNNKDIYEGDIVTFRVLEGSDAIEGKGEVLFVDGMFCFKKGVWWATNDRYFMQESLEVIGNIFENPELLSS